MPAFRKFDPYAFIDDEDQGTTPAKVAKTANADGIGTGTLATLADLAAVHSKTVNLPTWRDAKEKRAASIKHEGGIPRAWAGGFARLHPDRPPGDVPTKRWQQFIDDIGRFLDADWAEKAAALGWGPLDLFGCDRERPFARIDHAGLLWLLDGDKLIELDRHRMVIERRTGARQTFRRRPVAVGEIVLAWELVPERPKPAATV
jgi:hypothetical protein